jgi:hypothetical protein
MVGWLGALEYNVNILADFSHLIRLSGIPLNQLHAWRFRLMNGCASVDQGYLATTVYQGIHHCQA